MSKTAWGEKYSSSRSERSPGTEREAKHGKESDSDKPSERPRLYTRVPTGLPYVRSASVVCVRVCVYVPQCQA